MPSAAQRSIGARRRRLTMRLALAALAAGLVAMAGCGDGTYETAAEALGPEQTGSVAPLVQCKDWVTGTDPEKLATIRDIRSQINVESGTIETPPLSDDEAQEVFDNACSNSFAQSFRLYVLYSRAAGFAPLMRDQP